MPRSVYFGQNVKSEKELYEDLIIESVQVYGFDMQYLPRHIVSQDMLLNEDTETRFDNAFDIEMYIETVDGYEGDGVLMSKFGLEIRNQLKIAVSRRRWEQGIGKWNKGYNNYRPSEGDLVYIPGINGLFEIKYVDLESPFHQLNNLPVYKMTLQLFEYRGEDLNTGNAQIDAVQNQSSTPSSYRATFTYRSGSPKFNLNEYVTIGYTGTTSTAQAKITDLQYKAAETYPYYVQLSNLTFTDGVIRPLVSLTSTSSSSIASIVTTASGTIIHVYTLTDGDAVLNDGDISIQNNPIQTRANDVIDFTEVNPFGDTNDT
jgi:hypothetical protein